MSSGATSYMFDSFAVLVLLRNESGADLVQRLLDEVKSGRALGYLSAVNLTELVYIVTRRKGREAAMVIVESVTSWGLQVIDVSTARAVAAGDIKAKYQMSLADAFCVASAVEKKATLVTGDDEMKPVTEVDIIWLGARQDTWTQ